VAHESLGPERAPEQTALVACLAGAPSRVYSALSGAI
jgi:hypothetical protein